MAVSLLQDVQFALTPHLVRSAASWLGESPLATEKALGASQAAVLQGVLQASRDPARREELLRLISDRGNDRWLLHHLNYLFQGRARAEHANLGQRFLGLLFGDRGNSVTRRVAEVSGVAPDKAAAVLAATAPHVLAALGEKLRRGGTFSPQGLSSMLESESDSIATGWRPEWGDLIGGVTQRAAGAAAASAAAGATVGRVTDTIRDDRLAAREVREIRDTGERATAAGVRMRDDDVPAVARDDANGMVANTRSKRRWGRASTEGVDDAAAGGAADESERRGFGLGAIFVPLAALLLGWGLWTLWSHKPQMAAVPAPKTVAEAAAPTPAAKVEAPAPTPAPAPEVKVEAPAPAPAPVAAAPVLDIAPQQIAEAVPGLTTYFGTNGAVDVPPEATVNPDYNAAPIAVAEAQAPAPAPIAAAPVLDIAPQQIAEAVPGLTTYFGTNGAVDVPPEATVNPDYNAAPVAVAEAPVPAPAPNPAPVAAAPVLDIAPQQIAEAVPGLTTYFGTNGAVAVPPEAVMVAGTPPPAPVVVATANATELNTCQTKVNAAANSGPIHFRTAKADLTDESETALQRLVAAIKACPGIKLRVEGHTDNVGAPDRNQVLSENRARTVAEFLTENGIEASRVTAVGFGETRPVAPNDSAENKARNRRIDFIVVDGST